MVSFVFLVIKRLAEGTTRVYKALPKKLKGYAKAEGITLSFNYWTKETLNSFSNYLYGQGYLNDTVNNQIKALKAFLNWAYKKHHNNQSYKGYKVTWESHSVISLSTDELNRVYSCDLSEYANLERVRDLFCIGCYTAQRYSDLQQLEPSQIDGNYWNVHSEKTRKLIKVPLSNKTLTLLKKYDYNPPKLSNQKFNKALKRVGEIAGINTPVQKVSYSGSKRTTIKAPKYSFMSSHTARRTGITLLIEMGVPLPIIQKLTGHSDIKTLLKYDGTSINNLFAYLEEL